MGKKEKKSKRLADIRREVEGKEKSEDRMC